MIGQIPFSNPAGNNQTSPSAPISQKANPIIQGNIPGSPTQGQNPFVPNIPSTAMSTQLSSTTGGNPSVPQAPGVPNVGGLNQNPANVAGNSGALQKQLTDIYGKGVGGDLFNLINNMSGTDSQVMQEFIASLQPQMATAQANVNASLGAGGVGANSSVAAIADSNLQAQEFGAISGEEAKLTQSQEELTANLLMGMKGDASKEVSQSGWNVFADVVQGVVGDATNVISALHGGGQQQTVPGSSGSDSSSGDEGGW